MREQPDLSTNPRPRRPPAREIGAVLLGLLALAFSARSAWMAREEARAARARVAEARRERASLEARLRSFRGRSPAEGRLLSQAAAASESPPEKVVSTLARLLPADARLERLTIEYGAAISLDMRVVARAPADWDLFLARLIEDGTVADVVPGPERRESPMRTSLRARWAGGRR